MAEVLISCHWRIASGALPPPPELTRKQGGEGVLRPLDQTAGTVEGEEGEPRYSHTHTDRARLS